ncbi:hypothetical protein D3OALGB2SA_100 [Olavius algarvensis associated proteobacterium Delta 3]|nr:hypothetical protein D3OALGB2SA_100 [Olavius algarvensis associated proteobacterium Delta 3]
MQPILKRSRQNKMLTLANFHMPWKQKIPPEQMAPEGLMFVWRCWFP